ncbi:hypothetical protein [Rhizobacter sp. OV335]|uniref:hypothetical protein n=1 Tax=Rhizobacter sp. OV335 TaxID=1500264 RepID=UPI0009121C19|nr:hypothetical protein [Rhizobacter sp. OV335]SHM52159.1 hypothetical protein SAMN02787076_01485 [Rhizobacter sp. OV335]
MTQASPEAPARAPWRVPLRAAGACLAAAWLASCGGGGNPLGNPSTITNPSGATGQRLSYAYFQKCINPIFLAALPITHNGTTIVNTCAGSGCHDTVAGTGGAFRIATGATPLDVTDPANTPDAIRDTDMYKNFYSAQGEVVGGSTTQSRLLAKPLLINVLHGGGQIFANDQDPNVKLIEYWITHPSPSGQDEFSTATYNMFTPADPNTGTCNTN